MIYHVFWPVPSKNSGIYTFSIPKSQKHGKTDKKLAGSLHAWKTLPSPLQNSMPAPYNA